MRVEDGLPGDAVLPDNHRVAIGLYKKASCILDGAVKLRLEFRRSLRMAAPVSAADDERVPRQQREAVRHDGERAGFEERRRLRIARAEDAAWLRVAR